MHYEITINIYELPLLTTIKITIDHWKIGDQLQNARTRTPLEEFRKGDEIYGMTIESVVPRQRSLWVDELGDE